MTGLVEWIRSHRADVSIILFLLTAFYGIVFTDLHQSNWGDEMLKLGDNLARHGAFANPFSVMETGPTAANPPLYPLMLAIFIKIFRRPILVSSVAVFGCVVANAFTAALLPRLSIVFFGDLVPGVIGSLLWIPAMPLLPSWDTNYTVTGILLFCVVTAALLDTSRNGWKPAVSGGILAGLLFLLNPSSLLISVPWVVFLTWRTKAGLHFAVRHSAILLLVLSCFIVGWCARNYVQLGGWVVRTNLGMTLFASNNDCAESSMIRDELNGCYQSHHPNNNLAEAELLYRIGEVQFDKSRIAETRKWIAENPTRFGQLTIARVREFWFPAIEVVPPAIGPLHPGIAGWLSQQNARAYAIWVITLLSIPGFVLMVLRRQPFAPYIAMVLVVYPLIYYVVVSDMRYRYPVLWLSLLMSGYFVAYLGSTCVGTLSNPGFTRKVS